MEFDLEVKVFTSPAAFRSWLEKNHQNSPGLWLRIFKKNSSRKSIVYAEALDEALCFGWIDGQRRSYDAESFVQRFTKRKARSIWSKRNREHVARLIDEKKMTPAGHEAVEGAKADGRWEAAYDSPKTATVPDDFVQAVSKNKKAKAFFDGLSKSNRFAICHRLQTAKKPETRARRFAQLIEMMKEGKKPNG